MNKKGQTLIEYSILIVIILAAFIATGNYIKRSMQGRWKSAVDDFGDQYDPRTAVGSTTYTMQTASNSLVTAVPDTTGVMATQRLDITNSTENTVGDITVK